MTHRTRMLALALVVSTAAACKQDQAAGEADAAEAAASTAPAPAPAAPPAGAPSDAQIAAIVLAANSADSATGAMAAQHGTNAQVKRFAELMVTDHGGVNAQAVALAQKLGLAPEENPTSRQLTQGGEQSRQQLGAQSGASFDQGYIGHEVEYHQAVLDALDQTLIPSAQNAELKALLQQVRPAVASHLEMAKGIQKELQGSR
jgi:putative membrane protein